MTKKVVQLDTKAGIQRDGTTLDKQVYSDGVWCRFQRGRPRKMGGYREMTHELSGVSRGIFVESQDGYNEIFNGHQDGFQRFECDNSGVGAGIANYQFGGPILTVGSLVGGSLYNNGSYANVPLTGGNGFDAMADIVVAGNAVTSVTITVGGNSYVVGDVLSAAAADIGGAGSGFTVTVATVDERFTPSPLHLWQIDGFYDATGAGDNLIVAHPGHNLLQIDNTNATCVMVCNPTGDVMYPLMDTAGDNPTDAHIEVSGGVVALHPYLFVYGDNGLIKNCSAGNLFNWNGADANETNVSSQKVVKGLPVRGGSNAPSGLFWALDSLIRVSYAPQNLGVSGTANYGSTIYWKYDIVGQTSILSSQSVIEYDGIYYWIGVDRFLLYNGVIKEIPNEMNQNYFFDNLNYSQRQKVWATKVTRFGEIWWFYPKGDATECNDAIIYNVRYNIWYDAGQALGAQRSAGFYSQVLGYPVMGGTDLSESVTSASLDIATSNGSTLITTPISAGLRYGLMVVATGVPVTAYVVSIAPSTVAGYYSVTLSEAATADSDAEILDLTNLVGGADYVDGTYTNVPLTGGTGAGAEATVEVSAGAVTSVTITNGGAGYVIGDTLSASDADLGNSGIGAGFAIDVLTILPDVPADFDTPENRISLWQHEIGVNRIQGQDQFAIYSMFETSDIGLVTGGPPQTSPVGDNNWLRIERVEPDFVQTGEMELYVVGRPYAQAEDVVSDPYVFDSDTNKIDMREQRRELRLRFVSNTQNGDYQLGTLLLSVDAGDVRGY